MITSSLPANGSKCSIMTISRWPPLLIFMNLQRNFSIISLGIPIPTYVIHSRSRKWREIDCLEKSKMAAIPVYGFEVKSRCDHCHSSYHCYTWSFRLSVPKKSEMTYCSCFCDKWWGSYSTNKNDCQWLPVLQWFFLWSQQFVWQQFMWNNIIFHHKISVIKVNVSVTVV